MLVVSAGSPSTAIISGVMATDLAERAKTPPPAEMSAES